MLPVFVYGTLKPGYRNYRRYCQGRVLWERSAFVWGRLFDFPALSYPGMAAGESRVRGFLLALADEALLSQLDELEGYDPHAKTEENEYQRREVTAYDRAGEPIGRAWTYIVLPEKVRAWGGVLLPSGIWLEPRQAVPKDASVPD